MACWSALNSFLTEDGTAHITVANFLKMAYKEVSEAFDREPPSVFHVFVPKATYLLSPNLLNQSRILVF